MTLSLMLNSPHPLARRPAHIESLSREVRASKLVFFFIFQSNAKSLKKVSRTHQLEVLSVMIKIQQGNEGRPSIEQSCNRCKLNLCWKTKRELMQNEGREQCEFWSFTMQNNFRLDTKYPFCTALMFKRLSFCMFCLFPAACWPPANMSEV
jgi:hypothetical protein